MPSSPRRWVLVPVISVALLGAGCTEGVSGQPDAAPPQATTTTTTAKRLPSVSDQNPDPSLLIPDIVKVDYQGGLHAASGQRVAYDKSPPFGGAHDGIWADCAGIVYKTAVRNEHMVHALEHGTVWIAYNPDQIKSLDKLRAKVEGQPYLMLSPYPGLDRPISLQSWGHQLKLDSADDERIDQFIKALRANRYTTPEPGARCDTADPEVFNPDDPPPFDPTPPGPDAMPVTPR
jgi:Protein of unknown function (DUF3105)